MGLPMGGPCEFSVYFLDPVRLIELSLIFCFYNRMVILLIEAKISSLIKGRTGCLSEALFFTEKIPGSDQVMTPKGIHPTKSELYQ